MRASIKKSIAISLAALTLGAGLAASATPASAHMFFGGGGHFGGGGFGHFGGGGFGHFGGWNHGGWNHWNHWNQFGWNHRWGYGGGYYAGGYDDCIRWRPSYDNEGNYIGRHPVNVCYTYNNY